ncbi:MAG: DUF3368 domain-containing protein [Dehalococcoidia bacterium]
MEALRLAVEVSADVFITDDDRARRAARRLGISTTGTAGLLIRVRERGIIPSAVPLLDELRRRGQWLSDRLIEQVGREEQQSEDNT